MCENCPNQPETSSDPAMAELEAALKDVTDTFIDVVDELATSYTARAPHVADRAAFKNAAIKTAALVTYLHELEMTHQALLNQLTTILGEYKALDLPFTVDVEIVASDRLLILRVPEVPAS